MKIKLNVWWTNPESSAEPYFLVDTRSTDMTTKGWVLVKTFEYEVTVSNSPVYQRMAKT
jgi:hypothetical protein